MAKTASYFLPAGHWFLSLYNDDGDANEVSFVARVAPELTRNCPKGCSGRGECVLGKCHCHTGFDGPDCGQSKCINSTHGSTLGKVAWNARDSAFARARVSRNLSER